LFIAFLIVVFMPVTIQSAKFTACPLGS